MPTTPRKRRKPKAARKEQGILIRVTADQKAMLSEAADRAGLDLSSWLRALGVAEATRLGVTMVGSAPPITPRPSRKRVTRAGDAEASASAAAAGVVDASADEAAFGRVDSAGDARAERGSEKP